MKESFDKRALSKFSDTDNYWTPDIAVAALLGVEEFEGLIWEPACGTGNISKFLKKQELQPLVISTDLYYHGYGEGGIDFLMENEYSKGEIQNIITNPPYSIANSFLKRALSIATEKVAFLMRLQYLQGLERTDIFEKHRLRVHVFRRRVPFTMPDGTIRRMVAYAWYVFDLTSTEKLITLDYI